MVGWKQILEHWALVELDLLETFGQDIADPTLDRPWPWWRDRIIGLLTTTSRLNRVLSAV